MPLAERQGTPWTGRQSITVSSIQFSCCMHGVAGERREEKLPFKWKKSPGEPDSGQDSDTNKDNNTKPDLLIMKKKKFIII